MATIQEQVAKVKAEIKSKLEANAIIAVNQAAIKLQLEARRASPSGQIMGANRKGKYVKDAIKVYDANSFPATAKVWIDFDEMPEAVYIHERYSALKMTPKTCDHLYIPLTDLGRQHELHARDSEDKGLKGFMPASDSKTGKARMFGDTKKQGGPDYILKKSANVGACKYAGYLTKTAERIQDKLISLIAKLLVK